MRNLLRCLLLEALLVSELFTHSTSFGYGTVAIVQRTKDGTRTYTYTTSLDYNSFDTTITVGNNVRIWTPALVEDDRHIWWGFYKGSDYYWATNVASNDYNGGIWPAFIHCNGPFEGFDGVCVTMTAGGLSGISPSADLPGWFGTSGGPMVNGFTAFNGIFRPYPGSYDHLGFVALRIPWTTFFAYVNAPGTTIIDSTLPSISVTATAGGAASAYPVYGVPGSLSTLTASPPAGLAFAFWTVTSSGGGTLSSAFANPAVFTFGTNNASVTAHFEVQPRISGILSSLAAGINGKPLNWLAMVAEPVDTGSGAHVMNRSLLKLRGTQELDFTIDYSSLALFGGVLGVGWSHSFETHLQTLPDGNVKVAWSSKNFNIFTRKSGSSGIFECTNLTVIHDTLVQNPDSGFTLKEPSQRRFEFDASGRLRQIVNNHGQARILSYQGSSALPVEIRETISGKALTLTYTGDLLTQVSDGAGRRVSFTVDSSNHLASYTKTDGTVSQTHQFHYDSAGRILDEVNPEGVTVFTDTYDSQGRIAIQDDAVPGNLPTHFFYDESQTNLLITTVTDRTGATNVYVHNDRYLLLSVTDGLGGTTSFGYDAFGNRVVVTNALEQVQRFGFDTRGNQIYAVDSVGFTNFFGYDDRNNLIAVTNAAGSTASFVYDTTNNLTASVDFATNQATMCYDEHSLLVKTFSPRGGTATVRYVGGLPVAFTNAVLAGTGMAYDAIGRILAVTNAVGFVSTNAYDLNDNLVAASDGLGNTWRYTYDSAGHKLTEVDPLGNTTRFTYNGNGNLIGTTNALAGVTLYSYDGEDRLVGVTDANGHTRRMAYDAAGRLAAVVDPLNNTNSFVYDAGGNLVAAIDALGVTNLITTYDGRNQPVVTKDALGNRKSMTYDVLQRLVQTVDALNRTNSFGYDVLSRLTSSTDPMAFVTHFEFDADGNRDRIVNPRSAKTTFQFDLANRLTNNISATTKQTSYVLDGRNLATQVKQPSGETTTFTYDGAGRLVQSQDSDGTTGYTYDGKSRLRTVTEGSQTITREYDELDRLTRFTDTAGNVLQYAYDPVGNLTNLTYPDGKQVAYGYDAANRLTSVKDWDGRITTYGYNPNGAVVNITHPNETITERAYDAAGRLIHQRDATAAGNPIYLVDYTYDPANQIINEDSQPAPTPYQPSTVRMLYDDDNALVLYNGLSVSNDLNGNMVFGPLTNCSFITYTYDAKNRLKGVGGVTYSYDPAGNRIAVTNAGEVTQFVVNPNAALSQVLMRTKNGVTTYYVYGLGLLYEVTHSGESSVVRTYHYDYRGSTVALTDEDGNLSDSMSYSPYGCITARTGNADTLFLFNGAYGVMTDPNGLLYMRARYYSLSTCRYLSQDPLGPAIWKNLYSYADGDPTRLIDPQGLCAEDQRLQDLANSVVAVYRVNNEFGSEDASSLWNLLTHTFLVVTAVNPVTGKEYSVAAFSWTNEKVGSWESPFKGQNLRGADAAMALGMAHRVGGPHDAQRLIANFLIERRDVGGFYIPWDEGFTCKVKASAIWGRSSTTIYEESKHEQATGVDLSFPVKEAVKTYELNPANVVKAHVLHALRGE